MPVLVLSPSVTSATLQLQADDNRPPLPAPTSLSSSMLAAGAATPPEFDDSPAAHALGLDDGAARPLPDPQPTSQSASDTERRVDDIKVEYHPASGRSTKIYHLEDYQRERPKRAAFTEDFSTPWAPFNSLQDFLFAEVALDCELKPEQVQTLLDITNDARSPDAAFTLRTF